MAAAAVHTVAAAADMGENAECESISDGCVMAGSWSDEHIWKKRARRTHTVYNSVIIKNLIFLQSPEKRKKNYIYINTCYTNFKK